MTLSMYQFWSTYLNICENCNIFSVTIFVTLTLEFLPRDALLSAVYAVVVCLSVCLCVCVCVSHTPVLYQNG